ncbi:glycoside hydrolase family 43 protein [Solirubrobacter sp. CPCC 204708]|uniref:Glycoside hydrolase family 43 protein n=1 Tax=Solirubrobacter deserti TaxID=2282478 RepID=A0ABT4RRB2_9ACTN|nr:glycoside hydrolase family 43 protein [Solirubrobacter deserti]MBE2314744.1 glycoside hydrolase family 43 protein [Solirubrobacter deserti]MDA0141061.1 glycoside hydrolase family 43 protein [Solirubrobacter deserti]
MKVYDGYFADPFVLRLPEGGYAAYGTGSMVDGRAFEILRSADLVHWERVGGALEPLDGFTDYWAPEVAFHDGAYYLYYSPGVGDQGHRVRVAVCESPWGPFRDAGVVLTPGERFAIDASPFRDADGQWYLYYACDVLEGERVGTTVAVDRLVTMTEVAGEPRVLLRASDDWQIFLRDREMYGAVYDWHTLEGPFVVRRDGRYVLFYSGGSWERDTYGVSYAIADHPLGPFTEPEVGPVVLRDGRGHNCVVDDSIVYHAWEGERRVMCVAPLRWDGLRPRAVPA